jgi:hypothetical protein
MALVPLDFRNQARDGATLARDDTQPVWPGRTDERARATPMWAMGPPNVPFRHILANLGPYGPTAPNATARAAAGPAQ